MLQCFSLRIGFGLPNFWICGESSEGVEKDLRLEHIARVDHPDISHSVLPALRDEFVPHERGRRRAEVDVSVWMPMVGDVPIDSLWRER